MTGVAASDVAMAAVVGIYADAMVVAADEMQAAVAAVHNSMWCSFFDFHHHTSDTYCSAIFAVRLHHAMDDLPSY